MKLRMPSCEQPSPQTLLLAMTLIAGVVLIGFDLLVRRPTGSALVAIRNESLKRERELALSARLIRDHPRMLERLRTLESMALIRLGSSNPAVEVLSRSALEHHLELSLVEPGLTENIGPQKRTPISMHLEGSLGDFLAWMRDVEASHFPTTVDQILIEGAPTSHHTFRVVLTTYSYDMGGEHALPS